MSLNESELEEKLRRLRPCLPDLATEERIAGVLSVREIELIQRPPTAAVLRTARPAGHGLRSFAWALGGAAMAVAVILWTPVFGKPANFTETPGSAAAAISPETLEHVEATAEIITAEDEGIVLSEDQEPLRQVRYTSLERHVWTNPATGARMEFEIPRQDVRFTPVAMQ